jgi:hypothetical protein
MDDALIAPKPGFQTSEFLLTSAGLFISSLVALLTAFGVLHLTPEQTSRIYDFTAISWVVLPGLYGTLRAHTKSASLKAIAAVEVAKQETETAKQETETARQEAAK